MVVVGVTHVAIAPMIGIWFITMEIFLVMAFYVFTVPTAVRIQRSARRRIGLIAVPRMVTLITRVVMYLDRLYLS